MNPGSSQAPPPIRVRSVPAGHDYVRHALAPCADVAVPDDPVLDPADPARWWPHPVLEAAERPGVLDGADVVHVHFGYEHRTPRQVAEFVDAVRSRGLPLVVTVHDLTNPHEPDPAAHLERTGHLVRGADAVITLTRGAADEIRRRWGVDARVIPHPRLMSAELTEPHRLARLDRAGAAAGGAGASAAEAGASSAGAAAVGEPPSRRRVGVVLGSLRAGVAVEDLLPAVVEALPTAARLTVMVRSDALAAARSADHPRHRAAVELDRLAEHPRVDVQAHEHLPEADLCAALDAFDALLLPHRHGTHSGWLELCRDLGLPPVIPRIGYLAEQWGPDAAVYSPPGAATEPTGQANPADTADVAGLRRAIAAALDGPPVPARSPDAEDTAVADAHAAVYRATLARGHT